MAGANPLRFIGKRHMEIMASWAGSGMAFGTTAALGICYFTDWKTVLQYLPYYSGKYATTEPEK